MATRKGTKQIDDSEIALAICECKTKKEAAEKCGLSARQLYEREQAYTVQALIRYYRGEVLKTRLEALEDVQTLAAQTIRDIMQDTGNSAETRLKAACAALDAGRQARQELRTIESGAIEAARNAERQQAFDISFNF